ncbi:uncharacterized protein PRCAT00000403001 [Priceomyces carsonii]|uniref:uncharacterized protein n=1 Tax=Priceomyces carsonii TaxID=28549 RepID=UPI002ED951C5|nr:unnamed protein product [Priceomyces carsonii]
MLRLSMANLRSRMLTARRYYKVLALESSCDDSCVALLERKSHQESIIVLDHCKRTLNSATTGGIVPTDAHEFHQYSMAKMIDEFCKKNGLNSSSPPDLICCTRGPGMVGSLSAGLQIAKGISLAWRKPLVGVHHMLGHIMIANLPKPQQKGTELPRFPFLSLLCSGGHTMLVLLKSLIEHEIIIDTVDIAAGDSIDKCAREIGLRGNMLGKELERYVSGILTGSKVESSPIINNSQNEIVFRLPMRGPKHLKRPEVIQFSFASFLSVIKSYKKTRSDQLNTREKEDVAFKVQEAIFDHLIDRINIALKKHGHSQIFGGDNKFYGVQDFICSGGVASNKRLREKLFNNLLDKECTNGFNFHFPDVSLCTDNAVMIGIAGIEIFEKLKLKSNLSILPIRKWPLDELLQVDGWVNLDDEEISIITKD